jgi:hypothetical protein
MNKTLRDRRQVIVHQALSEPGDIQRLERLVRLLSAGIERLLSEQKGSAPESLDFQADVLPNVCTMKGMTRTEGR